jgi:hypothetical protein
MSEQLDSLEKPTRDRGRENMIAGLRRNDLREQETIFREDAMAEKHSRERSAIEPPVSSAIHFTSNKSVEISRKDKI